jgi:hypothetical protein
MVHYPEVWHIPHVYLNSLIIYNYLSHNITIIYLSHNITIICLSHTITIIYLSHNITIIYLSHNITIIYVTQYHNYLCHTISQSPSPYHNNLLHFSLQYTHRSVYRILWFNKLKLLPQNWIYEYYLCLDVIGLMLRLSFIAFLTSNFPRFTLE